MQRKVWRPRLSIDLAADVVEKVLHTGTLCAFAFLKFILKDHDTACDRSIVKGKLDKASCWRRNCEQHRIVTFTAGWSHDMASEVGPPDHNL